MTLHPVFTIFSLFSFILWDLANSSPVFPHLRLFCRLPPFTVPCKVILARPDERETYPYHLNLSFYDGQEVCVRPDCLLDLGTDFLVGNMVFV